MKLHTWTDLAADGSVKAIKYSFGPATANTLAARLDDGTWLAVSPAAGLPEGALEELAKDGVSALVAPNGFHHMGQSPWRARFPKAVSYAPAGSLARLASKSKDVAYQPLDELVKLLPKRIRFILPEGTKIPDLLMSVGIDGGNVFFSGDLISNTVSEDVKPVPRFIFGLLGGGAGYRFNKVPAALYLRDRAGWKRSVLESLEASPPTVVLPAHGNPIREDAAAQTRAILV